MKSNRTNVSKYELGVSLNLLRDLLAESAFRVERDLVSIIRDFDTSGEDTVWNHSIRQDLHNLILRARAVENFLALEDSPINPDTNLFETQQFLDNRTLR